jgi:cytochrome c oxidase subunit 4
MSENGQHVITPKTYGIVFVALLVLMLATIVAGEYDAGNPYNLIIALAIAVAKMILIVLFFMHVLYSSKLVWVVVGAGFFWFIIMVMITLSDYLTRDWVSNIVTS